MIMKNQLLNLKMIALMCLMMVLGGGNVWAEQYKIVFAKGTSDNNTAMTKTTSKSDVISSGVEYVASFITCTNVYNKSEHGLKLGKSKKPNSGTIEFSIADGYQKNIKKITIKSVKFGSDTGTLTLYNGTTSLKSEITPGTDCVHTFDTPTTVSSIKLSTSAKRAYISEIILETEEANNPTLKASESALDFGSVENNTSKDLTFKLSGSKLTADATLRVAGDYFTVTPTSVPQTDGTIPETDVTISYNPTAVGSHTATLTISSTGATDKTITLTGTSANAYTVAWNVNGNVYTDGTPTTKVVEGEKVTVLPTTPSDVNGKVFVGWTNASLSAPQDAAPKVLFTDVADAPKVTGDVTYYAVFAKRAGDGEVTYTKLTSNQFKTNATYVIGAESKKTGSIDYFYKYENVNTDCWGEMTSDLSVNSPIVFVLSGTADKLMAKDNNGNYLKCVSKNFQMSSTEASIKLNTDGTLLDVTGESYWLRYNSYDDCGLRWYAKDKTIGNLAYFYEVSGGYTYSGYCTTVEAAAEPTYTSKNLTFVAHEGKDYYATFSNAKVVFMPATVVPMAVVVDATGKISEKDVFTPVTATIGAKSVDGYYIPAETGVLLWTDKTSVEYYTVDNYAVDALAADANMLKPSVTAGAFVPENNYLYYKLAYGDWKNKTQLGFYWGADNGGAFYVKAGTAYLAVPEANTTGAKGFTLNGEATGIEGVNANVENAKAIYIYNLNGQRVASMAKPGLYIVNGKKVVRK